MMKEIHTEIIIQANRAIVWDVLTDFKHYSDWNPFIITIKGNCHHGGKIVISIKPENQRVMTFKPKIISLKTNEELRWLGRLLMPGIFDGEHIFLLEAISENETLLIHKELFSGFLSTPILYKIAGSTKAGFIAMNEALKKRCEGIMNEKMS